MDGVDRMTNGSVEGDSAGTIAVVGVVVSMIGVTLLSNKRLLLFVWAIEYLHAKASSGGTNSRQTLKQ